MSSGSMSHDGDLDRLRGDFETLTREETALTTHPNEDTWISFASGELVASERDRLADHVVSCAECATVYRAVTHVRDAAPDFDAGAPQLTAGRVLPFWRRSGLPAALAASLTIVAGGLLAWNVSLQQRAARLEAELDRARRTPVVSPRASDPAPTPTPAPAAHVNVPIIDLEPPSRTRGTGARRQVISIASDARLVALIVNTAVARRSTDYTLDLVDSRGATLWAGTGLRPGLDGTLSVALPATLLVPGDYVFSLAETNGARLVHRYPVTVVSR